jgi:hypothetical protein
MSTRRKWYGTRGGNQHVRRRDRIELACELGVALEQLPQANEGTHDLDIDLNGARAS